MSRWLHNFAYRVGLGVDNFLVASISVILITALSIGFQSVKAALINPVKSLKTD